MNPEITLRKIKEMVLQEDFTAVIPYSHIAWGWQNLYNGGTCTGE